MPRTWIHYSVPVQPQLGMSQSSDQGPIQAQAWDFSCAMGAHLQLPHSHTHDCLHLGPNSLLWPYLAIVGLSNPSPCTRFDPDSHPWPDAPQEVPDACSLLCSMTAGGTGPGAVRNTLQYMWEDRLQGCPEAPPICLSSTEILLWNCAKCIQALISQKHRGNGNVNFLNYWSTERSHTQQAEFWKFTQTTPDWTNKHQNNRF